MQARDARESRARTLPWRAAAAILLALGAGFFAWRTFRGPQRDGSVESLLAEGRPALREGSGAPWRALTEEERSSGVRFAGPALDLATPLGASAQVMLGSAGRLDAEGASRISLEGSGEAALFVALERGAIALERLAGGAAWRVSTPEGALRLERGAVEVACLERGGSPAARALLRAGAAALDFDPRTELVPGREVWLRGGALLADGDLDTLAHGEPARTDAGTATVPDPAATVAPPPTTASLRGTLSVPADAKMPDAFVVTLLRRERLPEVSVPHPHAFHGADFAIPDLKPGTYAVFVQAAGWAVWQRVDVELAAGAPAAALQVVLDAGASVRGRVLDHLGHPVEGAFVLSEKDTPSQLFPFELEQVPPDWTAITSSQADGAFELGHLGRGHHRLRATRAGHGAAWSEIDVPSAGTEPEVVLRLVEPGAIDGHVARDDGSPWPGAIVIASWIDTSGSFPERGCISFGHGIADAQGRFAIEDLPPGTYVALNVSEARESNTSRIPRVQQVRVKPGVRTRVELPGGELGTAVEGTLVGPDEKPVADLDVTLVPKYAEGGDWKSTRSRDDGRFDFPSLPPGTYVVYAGGNLGAELALQSELEVPAVPTFRTTVRVGGGTLRGRVLDARPGARSGAGLPGSVVILEVETAEGPMFAGRTVADAQGRYDLNRLPGAKYRVTAYSVADRLGQESVDGVSIGEQSAETVHDFELHPGAGLRVKVQSGDESPLAGARLRLVDETGLAVSFSPDDRTDAQGVLHVLGVKPGRWTLRASHEHFETTSTTLDLVADEERAVAITLQPSH